MLLVEELKHTSRFLSTKHLLYLLCHRQFVGRAMSPVPSPRVLKGQSGNRDTFVGGMQPSGSGEKVKEDIRKAFQKAAKATVVKEGTSSSVSMDVTTEEVQEESATTSPTSSTNSAKENAIPKKKRSSINRNLMITYSPKRRKRPSSSNSGSAVKSEDGGVVEEKKGKRGRPASSRSSVVSTVSEDLEIPSSSSASTISSNARSTSSSILRACRKSVKCTVDKDVAAEEDRKEDDRLSLMSGSSGRSLRSSGKRDVEKKVEVLEGKVIEGEVIVEDKEPEDKKGKEEDDQHASDEESSSGDEDSNGSDSSDEENAKEGVYVVQRIDDKKVVDGVTYYFIKWKGWHESSNTWEPLGNLDGCNELLEEFEKRYAEKKGRRRSTVGRRRRESEVVDEEDVQNCQEHMRSYGIFEEWPADKEPLSVEGVIHVDGVLTYIVKRKVRLGSKQLDRSNAVLVHASDFRLRYPALVIRFYEKRVLWTENPKTDEEQAYVASQMSLFYQNAGSSLGKIIAEDLDKEVKEGNNDGEAKEPADAETQLVSLSDEETQDEVMEVDDTQLDKDDDKFGLPEDMVDTDVSSNSFNSDDVDVEHDLVEQDLKDKPKKRRESSSSRERVEVC